jgi:hypothetical protein
VVRMNQNCRSLPGATESVSCKKNQNCRPLQSRQSFIVRENTPPWALVGMVERAAQRVMLMRMAQPALMPNPRYLDSPPPGMMQLCHRESVVQFINEVRCSRPYPPSPRAPSSGLALPQMSDPPTPSLSCTRLSPARAGV